MELSGPNPSPSQILKTPKGFAMMLALSLIPVILTAGFAVLFSNYLVKNWMQSLHICRTELLKTQAETKVSLQKLLALNKLASSLRAELFQAKLQYAAAIATENPALIATAHARLLRIQAQRRSLDQNQKGLISSSNLQMAAGLHRAVANLHAQATFNSNHSTPLFKFAIDRIQSNPKILAVHPDLPDIAPVYELNADFTKAQSLSVSWSTSFQTDSKRGSQWLQNQHIKKAYCEASLQAANGSFKEVLLEGKP